MLQASCFNDAIFNWNNEIPGYILVSLYSVQNKWYLIYYKTYNMQLIDNNRRELVIQNLSVSIGSHKRQENLKMLLYRGSSLCNP